MDAQVPGMAFASWGTEQGLPSNIALDIAQTHDGYLWLATEEESFGRTIERGLAALPRCSRGS